MTDEVQTPLPPGDVAPETASAAPADVPNAAPVVAEPTTAQASAPSAAGADTTSPIVASSPAEPQTFEQRVEARFLQVEAFLMKLPHSIAHAFSLGSAEPEELAKRAVAHLLDHNQ